MRRDRNIRDIFIGIILGVGVFCFILLFPRLSKQDYIPRQPVIVCLDKDMKVEKVYGNDEDIISVKDCVKTFDYSNDSKSILYLNSNNDILESNIVTGKVQEINVLGIKGDMRHLRYGPGESEISFLLNDQLYIYDYKQEKVINSIKCTNGMWLDYEWKGRKNLYYISIEDGVTRLYRYKGIDEEPLLLEKNILRFELHDTEERIYGIREYVKSCYGFGVEMGYDIVELNLVDGSIKCLVRDIHFENFLFECVGNQYVFYEESKKGRHNLYCLDVINGEKKCIYKTKENIVVGIIF